MSVNVLSHVGLWVSTLVNLILVLVLYRQFGLSAMASAAGHDNDGVPVGQVAPPLLVQRTLSDSATHELALDGRWSIVLFGTPHCEPCVEALDRFNRETPHLSGWGVRVVAAFNGIPEVIDGLRASGSCELEIVSDPDGASMSAWQVKVTPFALLVDPSRRVKAKTLASTEKRLTAFLDTAEGIVRPREPVGPNPRES